MCHLAIPMLVAFLLSSPPGESKPADPAPPVASPSAGSTAKPAGGSVLDFARSLPALDRHDGLVSLPLTNAAPWTWRGISDAMKLTVVQATDGKPGGVRVEYTRAKGAPAGCALVVPPGTFAGLTSLRIRAASDPAQRLLVSFKDSAGVVWSFPAFKADAGDSPVDLKVADATVDQFQNNGAKPTGAFDPASVYMVTILDINGFMFGAETACVVTVYSVEGVCK